MMQDIHFDIRRSLGKTTGVPDPKSVKTRILYKTGSNTYMDIRRSLGKTTGVPDPKSVRPGYCNKQDHRP